MNTTHLEELALNAWPALHTLVSDGWVLRMANGYTRRANSVSPLYAGQQPLEAKISAAEALYGARGQAAIFKLTAAAQPPELDAALEARGYVRHAPTSGQVMDLSAATLDAPGTTTLFEALTDAWVAAFCALGQVAARHEPTMRQMLGGLVPPHAFFLVRGDEGSPIACGLAVVEAGCVGLADIVTHPAHRRQGHARRLINDALAWARDCHAAHTAYLQVMLNNDPALKLYAGLGFREVYQYWYRVQ